MATLNLKTGKVFDDVYNAFNDEDIRFIILQGGSRSGKSFALLQNIIIYCLLNKNKIVSVCRKTFPALRATILRDFISIMVDLGIYKQNQHNKTENIYTFDTGSYIEFFSADNEQKLRGRKRDICLMNETNEFNFEEFTQLNIRTTEKMMFDFNPSESIHWIYDLAERKESILLKSNYKDNPFLDKSLIKEIENLINYDEAYYQIYGLGERGIHKTTIYTHWKYFEKLPETKETLYGLDLGFNDPCALVKIDVIDDNVYATELLYQSYLTSGDLVKKLNELIPDKRKEIICDTARPEMIEDIKRAGFNIKGAIKDIKAGIDSVKSIKLFINKESVNMLKEISNYKWKTNGDLILDEPVGVWDHSLDSLRYSIHYWKLKNKRYSSNNFKIYH